jgi:hypothetical protein
VEKNRGSHISGPGACPAHLPPSRPENGAPPSRDVVTVPSRQGLEAADLMRLTTGVGPVFHDRGGDSLAFLVPPGTAECWDLPGSQCRHTDADTGIDPDADTDPAARTDTGSAPTPGSAGACWLVPPHTDTAVTDPAVLRAALGAAARTLALTDGFAPPLS